MNYDEINKAILDLENGATTFSNMEKLASLYIVRDHFPEAVDHRSVPVNAPNNELMRVCYGKDISEVMNVINEHFQMIELVYPKEYEVIMQKLKDL